MSSFVKLLRNFERDSTLHTFFEQLASALVNARDATRRVVGYEKIKVQRTEAEAEAIANDRMALLVAKELRDAEVLALTRSVEHTKEGVKLTWQVYCVMDIAKEMPMTGVPKS